MTNTAKGESQQRSKGRTKWSETIKKYLLDCKKKELLLVNGEKPPRSDNGQKQGCMKIMKDLWEEKGYEDLQGFTSQHLRDQAVKLEKSLGRECERFDS